MLRRLGIALAALAGLALPATGEQAAEAPPIDRFDTVVIDAGHGGEDHGARGPGGLVEKDLVLDVARRLAARLSRGGLRVVMTRSDDRFVPLEERTAIANDARGDLFLSIHANATRDTDVRGIETFFLSLQASDDAAQRVAERENQAFRAAGRAAGLIADPLVAILGDLIATEHLRESNEFARLAQAELAEIDPARSRGVKQALFVVLAGVQMPASLVEIGFVTNPSDERDLSTERGRDEIVSALSEAVLAYGRRHDARRGIGDRIPAKRMPGAGGDR